MSGVRALLQESEHVSGTTWQEPFALRLLEDGAPWDLTGATARLRLVDGLGATVVDWTLGAGLELYPAVDPTYLCVVGTAGLVTPADDGEPGLVGGVLTAAPGVLHGDLKVALADGTVMVEADITLPIISSVTP
jgi:hypothetical protein